MYEKVPTPTMVAIGYDAAHMTLHVGFSLGGSFVDVGTLGIDLGSTGTFGELRFRGHASSNSTPDDGEVCEMRWFGGDSDNAASAPTPDSIKAAFASLSFLDP